MASSSADLSLCDIMTAFEFSKSERDWFRPISRIGDPL
jgi:hypothetical protein